MMTISFRLGKSVLQVCNHARAQRQQGKRNRRHIRYGAPSLYHGTDFKTINPKECVTGPAVGYPRGAKGGRIAAQFVEGLLF